MTEYTTDLLVGLAELLAAASIGTWRASGAYSSSETAIVIRAIPPDPDRLITLSAYPVGGGDTRGMQDHTLGLQIRLRAGENPSDCDDLADQIYDQLDSSGRQTIGGISVVDIWRQSYTSLGQDTARRWERSENFFVAAMRNTTNHTD